MGELFIHDLNPYLDAYGCDVFVETGTGKGTGLLHALRYRFKELYSIEIMKELFEECQKNITDPRIHLLNTNSIEGLKTILGELDPGIPTLFWLDAHFPGADFHFNSYDHLSDQPELHKPLREEIKLVASYRPNCKDVLIIDDLQIYEEGPFEIQMRDFKEKYGEDGLDFVEEAFGETHNFTRDYRHQGFLILTPKEVENED
tara:strand:- start:116 stop:721 length:606 start_codon:yes stop_codon:yes gene_type:complete